MFSKLTGAALFSVVSLAAAQIDESYLEVWSSSLCGNGDGLGFALEGEIWPTCQSIDGLFPVDLFERNEAGDVVIYVDGNQVQEGCKFGILEHNADVPDGCGSLIATIDSSTPCRSFAAPQLLTIAKCCGDDCDSLSPGFAATKKREAVARDVTTTKKRETVTRDVTAIKKRNPFEKRQDECVWNSDTKRDGVGSPQVVTTGLNCPSSNAESCAITQQITRSVSSTNTFGVSAEVGVSFFEIVQTSISFSYEYSYTEEESFSNSYTVNLSPGTTGYLTFTPELECSDGHFSGLCSWQADEDGTVCIPKFKVGETGEPAGEFNVVAELSP